MTSTEPDCAAFASDMAAIASSGADPSIPTTLFADSRFVRIAEAPEPHLPCAARFVSAREVDRERRTIAVLAMHALALDDHLVLIDAAIAAHRRGEIPTHALTPVLMPPGDFPRTVVMNYDDARIRAALRYYLDQPDRDEVVAKGLEADVLTGATARFLRETYGYE